LYQAFLHDFNLTTLIGYECHELQDDAGSFRLASATLSRHYDALILVPISQEPVRRAGYRVAATSNCDVTVKENTAFPGRQNSADRNLSNDRKAVIEGQRHLSHSSPS
jgi:hypothetical protein